MFRDTYRIGVPHETRADCRAAEELYHQQRAVIRGNACHALTDEVGALLNKADIEWSADDMGLLDTIHALLTEAGEIARRLGR